MWHICQWCSSNSCLTYPHIFTYHTPSHPLTSVRMAYLLQSLFQGLGVNSLWTVRAVEGICCLGGQVIEPRECCVMCAGDMCNVCRWYEWGWEEWKRKREILPLTSLPELLHGCFHLVQLIPAITIWVVPNISPHHLPQPTAPPPDHEDGAPEGITVTVLHSLEKLLAVLADVCLCETKRITSYINFTAR